MQLGGFRAAIVRCDSDQDVFGGSLRIFDKHIEIAVIFKHAGIEQFEFPRFPAPGAILPHQPFIRISSVRIFIQVLHVGMRWRAVEIVVALLHILAVVAFIACESEQPFFKDRIAAVPKRQRKADLLMAVADARDAVFIPAIRPRPRMIVRQILPCRSARAVIFAHGPPGALTEVGPPAAPVSPLLS